MLNLQCDRCARELKQPGALLFSPPRGEALLVEKYHLCVDCWSEIVQELKASRAAAGQKPPAK